MSPFNSDLQFSVLIGVNKGVVNVWYVDLQVSQMGFDTHINRTYKERASWLCYRDNKTTHQT